ncbi:hypothetical protein PYW07_003471 [Mythimna separata]|uniref:Carboxylesterase type B domain-containing protein n=1 Tax=Mythimna separata TaxID=271217 RepID=A0AAD8DQX1_MYTSE|nr:hypothetical protein PYW07_003471 [Mythimna separata]
MNTILILSVVAVCTIQTISCDEIVIEVEQGLLKGRKQETITKDSTYYSFENVPFAKPPIGSLRFKAPEKPEKWEGTRDATAQGPMCPQYNPISDALNLGSEDCLTCNIYTPDTSKELPVLFFLSGFAYFFDADVLGLYGPDFLVKDMVVVKCQYRNDVFGFLNLGIKDAPGNAAMKDQVEALKWVNKNIHAFGGDPKRVTISGVCTGSASVYHHMMSPMSSGLFHRAIMMSGVPSCDAIYLENNVMDKSLELAERFDCKTEDGAEMLNCLQAIPYEKLINSSYSMAREEFTNQLFKKMSTFVPVVEDDFGQERFITEDPYTSLNQAPLNKVKVLMGHSEKETLLIVNHYDEYLVDLYNTSRELLVPYKILRTNPTPTEINKIADTIKDYYFNDKEISVENMKEFVDMTSDSSMTYDQITFAKKISQFVDTYLFVFNSISSRNLYGQEGLKFGVEGVGHSDMVAYMFPYAPLNMTLDENTKALITQFSNRMIDFVVRGHPSCSADFSWPKFTPENRDYVEFTDQVTLKKDPKGEIMEFWDDVYEGYLP